MLSEAGKLWIIKQALADVKSAAASGKIKTTPGQYFYSVVKHMASREGIELPFGKNNIEEYWSSG